MHIKLEKFKKHPKIQLLMMIQNLIKNTRWNRSVFLVGDLTMNLILGKVDGEINLVIYYPKGGINFAEWLAKTTDCYSVLNNPINNEIYRESRLVITSMPQYKDIIINCYETKDKSGKYGTLTEDSITRLTSIDALYYDLQSENVLDLWSSGIDDLTDGIIRGNEHLDEILSKEPIKIMDIFIQASKFGFNIEKETWFAIIKHIRKLDRISLNILRTKFIEILTSNNPSCGIERLRTSGALKFLIPELYEIVNIRDNGMNVYYHTLNALDVCDNDVVARMSVLLHEIGKSNATPMLYNRRFFGFESDSIKKAKIIARRLNFREDEIEGIKTCIELHTRFWDMDKGTLPSDRRIKRFVNNANDWIYQVLCVMDADYKSQLLEKYQKITFVDEFKARMKAIAEADNEPSVELPINGNDIMKKFNLKASPLIGTMLDKVKKWCKQETLTKEECFEKLAVESIAN